ncbi:MAG: amidohydrolase family protein [Chloroflexota bacterium]
MNLRDFRPKPTLVTKETAVEKPKFPAIDAHNHLGILGWTWHEKPVSALTDVMDEAGITTYVDLDGGWGEDVLIHRLDKFKTAVPERYLVFGGVNWSKWEEKGRAFGEWAGQRLVRQVSWGAQGLKIWKPFGLEVTDEKGRLVPVDDTRLIPLWETAADLNIPVVIHTADPVAFFAPLTPENERWEELASHPEWHFLDPNFPSFETLIEQFATLVKRHPRTTFIGAHMANYAENLGWVSQLLDEAPNLYIDFSARLGEVGRQPYSARRFFIKYADRILFGTDASPNLDVYRTYYRFLETDDEYFNYGRFEPPGQGRWRIYGIQLPDDVLKKIYSENARKVLRLTP